MGDNDSDGEQLEASPQPMPCPGPRKETLRALIEADHKQRVDKVPQLIRGSRILMPWWPGPPMSPKKPSSYKTTRRGSQQKLIIAKWLIAHISTSTH